MSGWTIVPGTTPDDRFSYLQAGPADGTALLFLHGIGGGAAIWSAQLASFARLGYRAIAWDMPGYGGSFPLETASVGLFGDALAEFIGTLALERPVLVGHSIGGMIAQSFLADGLGSPRAVVLAQTSAAFGGRDPAWARDFVASRLDPLDRGETMAVLAAHSIPAMVGEEPDPDGVALAQSLLAGTPAQAYRESTLSMIGFDRREALGRIAVPVLLLAGSQDEAAPAATMAKMAERIPGAEYALIAGAGHFAMLERPALFDEAVAAFLLRTAPP